MSGFANGYTIVLLLAIALSTIFGMIVETLNLSRLDETVPREFEGFFDAERYRKAQRYLRVNTRFGLVRSAVTSAALIVFILLGGFGAVDLVARQWVSGPILTGLVFAGLLGAIAWLVQLPSQIYHTFVIEEEFGFNRTRPLTFALDQLKGIVIGAILGGAALAGVIWFFERAGALAWLWSWIAVTAFQLALFFIAPVVFLPLFNKFTPLPEGELKREIESYARAQSFKLQGIFSMDGSKRSTKANAYFTGFGRFRRIVLFDTLIRNHGVQELVAVLAHEIGHYRRRHIPRQMGLAILSTGVMFWVLSFFLRSPVIFDAFRMDAPSAYAGIVLFGLIYSPVSRLVSLYSLYLSRKHEFEADAFARETYGHPERLALALKKLSVENLANLRPHPLKVFLSYTHPPVLERLARVS